MNSTRGIHMHKDSKQDDILTNLRTYKISQVERLVQLSSTCAYFDLEYHKMAKAILLPHNIIIFRLWDGCWH